MRDKKAEIPGSKRSIGKCTYGAADSSVSDSFLALLKGGGGGGGGGRGGAPGRTDRQIDLRMDGRTDGRIFVWVGWWVVRTSLMTESIAETQPVLTDDEDVSDRITFPPLASVPPFLFLLFLDPSRLLWGSTLKCCVPQLIDFCLLFSLLPSWLSLPLQEAGRVFLYNRSPPPPTPRPPPLSFFHWTCFFFLSERHYPHSTPPPLPHPPICMEPLRLSRPTETLPHLLSPCQCTLYSLPVVPPPPPPSFMVY